MTTVKEFRQWLKRFPEDTEIRVPIRQPPSEHESYGDMGFQGVDVRDHSNGEGWEFLDCGRHYRDILRIGEID